MFVLTIVAIAYVLPKMVASQNGCLLDVVGKYRNDSLIIDQNRKLRYPAPESDGRLYFALGEPFYLICPAGSFHSTLIDDRELVLCNGDTLITALNSSQVLDFDDVKCDTSHRPLALIADFSTVPCAGGQGTWSHLQYAVTSSVDTIRPLSYCFDRNRLVPLYSNYTSIQWISVDYGYKDAMLVGWGYFGGDIIGAAYSAQDQFESMGLFEYITDEVFLDLTPLAAAEDLYFSYVKDTTYVVEILNFQWNTVNEGNWYNAEEVLRNLVEEGNLGEVSVYRGVSGVASLPDAYNNMAEIYLNSTAQTFPVPRWFWKIIYSQSTYSGLIVVGYNNPYVSKLQVDQEFTTSICRTDVLGSLNYIADVVDNTDSFAGFTYACALDLDDIVEPVLSEIVENEIYSVGRIPEVFQVNNANFRPQLIPKKPKAKKPTVQQVPILL